MKAWLYPEVAGAAAKDFAFTVRGRRPAHLLVVEPANAAERDGFGGDA